MNVKNYFMGLALAVFASSCQSPPADSPTVEAIYGDSRGESVWIFTKEESGPNGESVQSEQLSITRYVVRQVASTSGSCAFFADDMMALGVPAKNEQYQQLECGSSSFKILKCFDEGCQSSLIGGEWRTGLAPEFRLVPFQFIYNRCLGVTTISFTSFSGDADYIGTSLDLRGGIGLLADADGKSCQGNAINWGLRPEVQQPLNRRMPSAG